MKKQEVVRTYPYGKFNNPTVDLTKLLEGGYIVIMANEFDICDGYNAKPYDPPLRGIEYIVEKEIRDE